MSDLDTFREEYLPNAQGATAGYTKWRQQNPGEAAKWDAFRDAVLAGLSPQAPVLATKLGKALVAAGKMAIEGSAPPPLPPGSVQSNPTAVVT